MEALPKVNAEQLQKYLKGQVVLMFTADWCPDCQFIKPAMPEVEKDFADLSFMPLIVMKIWIWQPN